MAIFNKKKMGLGCAIRLDPHTDTSALTPNVDWIKRYFSLAFSSYLLPSPIFHQSALSVKTPVSA